MSQVVLCVHILMCSNFVAQATEPHPGVYRVAERDINIQPLRLKKPLVKFWAEREVHLKKTSNGYHFAVFHQGKLEGKSLLQLNQNRCYIFLPVDKKNVAQYHFSSMNYYPRQQAFSMYYCYRGAVLLKRQGPLPEKEIR